MAIFSGQHLQAGHGFSGVFKGITALFKPLIRLFTGSTARKSVDILRKVAAKPIAKTLIKSSKKELGKTALNVVSDILEGDNLKESLKKNGSSAVKNIATASLKKALENAKKPSKNTPTVLKSSKKKRKRTIFD